MIKIKHYKTNLFNDWNNFIANSKNGHFMFMRDYIEYHKDRFVDYSLLFYYKDKLIAVLPANIDKDKLITHGGLSFAGFVYGSKVTAKKMLDIFDALKIYLSKNNIYQILYKSVPYIYYKYPAQEDLYALFRNSAKLYRKDISSTIYLKNKIPYTNSRKGQVKKAKKKEFIIKETSDYKDFWTILTEILSQNHQKQPVHSLSEIEKLQKQFPENIKLHVALNSENYVIAGCVLYLSYPVIHVQYMAVKNEYKQLGALDLVIDNAINIYKDYEYFDFGNSNENEGKYLNEGLIFQKEGFGARAVTYDFYKIDIQK